MPGIHLYIVALLFLLFISCSSENQLYDRYHEFPDEKEVKTEAVILNDDVMLRYPFRIKRNGNRVVVHDLHHPDYYYHLFSYPDFKYLTAFGKRGEAPEEMLSAENIRFYKDNIWVLDANRSKLRLYCFKTNSDSLYNKEEIVLHKNLIRSLDFLVYNDSTFIIPDYSGENRIYFINRSGEIVKKMGHIPTEKKVNPNSLIALAQAWRSFIDYNPNNGILAMVTQLGEVLEIYNLKDSSQVVKYGPWGEPAFGTSDGRAIPTGIMGFSDVKVTDNYIYAVFHGRTFREIAEGMYKEHIDGGKYIYIFDLEGNPVRKYVLDRYVYGLEVDEEKGEVMMTEVNGDELVRCDIK